MPIVSVILTTYNSKQIVQPTIDSVLQQSLHDFEFLIIDDGSKDGTAEFLQESIDDPRVQVLSYPNHGTGGPSGPRNTGIELAQGEYIAFINHDDLWSAEKLADQVEVMQRNPVAGLVYSSLAHINENDEVLYRTFDFDLKGDVLPILLRANFIETGSNPLIRKSVFEELGGFNHKYTVASDWEMWLRIAKSYEFDFVPEYQVFFRDLPEALSMKVKKMERAIQLVFDDIYADLPEAYQAIRKEGESNVYVFLASRALKGAPSKAQGEIALDYIRRARKADKTAFHGRRGSGFKMWLAAKAHIHLPSQSVERVSNAYDRLRKRKI